MKSKHRKLLRELLQYSNRLGADLDSTATHESKYRDRQKAHMFTYKVLLAILSDHPDNDQSEYEFELAQEALKEMEELTKKSYPDRRGLYSFDAV